MYAQGKVGGDSPAATAGGGGGGGGRLSGWAGDEEEVDELLAWSDTLDYDSYVNDWLGLATSSGCTKASSELANQMEIASQAASLLGL